MRLIAIRGPAQGRILNLTNGQTLRIGRGQASDTQFDDRRMSRVHCLIQVDESRARLLDQASTSGTFVNGEKVEDRILAPGDEITAGESTFRFELEAAQEASTIGGQLFGRPKPEPPVMPLEHLVGESFAHYHLETVIATGNSGMVFKALDTEKQRPVALKVLTPDPSHSDEQRARFVRAMKTMLPVRHPHIVRLYNAGKRGPYCWAAMEFVDGEPMTDVIRRIGVEGMLDWREAFRVAVHIARALEEAWQRKIVHRNVTPANIMRRQRDRVCLLGDLMLAKALDGALAKQVTRPGQLVGEVAYLSPERTRGPMGADHRSDIYGLGATLYALLTGKAPFAGRSLADLVRNVREETPRPPKTMQLSVNDLFQDAVMKMLAKDPEDRYATPTALLQDLGRIGRYNNLEADWTEWKG